MTKLCEFSFLSDKIVLIFCDVIEKAMSSGVSRNSQQKLNPYKQGGFCLSSSTKMKTNTETAMLSNPASLQGKVSAGVVFFVYC